MPIPGSVLFPQAYSAGSPITVDDIQFVGRYIINIPPLGPLPGDGRVNEFDFSVPNPDPATNGTFDTIGFYIGNDATGDPAPFLAGFSFDLASPPPWVTYVGGLLTTAAGWGPPTQVWDGSFTNFALASPASWTVDPASDPNWYLPHAAPVNDDFANATDLGSASAGAVTGSNWGAGSETGEIAEAIGMTVWWKWTAPANGHYKFTTKGSTWHVNPAYVLGAAISVWTGSAVASLTGVGGFRTNTSEAPNPDADHNTQFSFDAVAGTTYYIQVDGYEVGAIALAWSIPIFTSFSPRVVAHGETVQIVGTSFEPGASVTVGFGSASTSFIDSARYEFANPSLSTAAVVLTLPDGTVLAGPYDLDVLPRWGSLIREGFSSGTEIDVDWTNPGGVTTWTLAHSDDGGASWADLLTSGPGTTGFNDVGLDPSKIYRYRLTVTYDDGEIGVITSNAVAAFCGYESLVDVDLGTWGSLPYNVSSPVYCGTDGATDYYAFQVSDTTGSTARPCFLALATAPHGVAPTPGSITVSVTSIQTNEINQPFAQLATAGNPYTDPGPLKVAFVPLFSSGPPPPPSVVFCEESGGTWVTHATVAVDTTALFYTTGFTRFFFGFHVWPLRLDEIALTFGSDGDPYDIDAIERVTAAGGQGPWARTPPGVKLGAAADPGVEFAGDAMVSGFSGAPWTAMSFQISAGSTGAGRMPAVGDLALFFWVAPSGATVGGLPGWSLIASVDGTGSRFVLYGKKLTLADITTVWNLALSPGEPVTLFPLGLIVLNQADLPSAVIGSPGAVLGTTSTAPGLTAPGDGHVVSILAGTAGTQGVAGGGYGAFSPAQDTMPIDPSGNGWPFGIGNRKVSAGPTGDTTAISTPAGDQYGIQMWFPTDTRYQDPAMTTWNVLTPQNGVVVIMQTAPSHSWDYLGDEVLVCDGSGNWTEAQATALPPGFPPGLHFFNDAFRQSVWFFFDRYPALDSWVMVLYPTRRVPVGTEALWKMRWTGSAVDVVSQHDTAALDCNAELVGNASVVALGPATSDSAEYWVLQGARFGEAVANLVAGKVVVQPPGGRDLFGAHRVGLNAALLPWGLLDSYVPFPQLDTNRPGWVIAKPGTAYWFCCPVIGKWTIGKIHSGS